MFANVGIKFLYAPGFLILLAVTTVCVCVCVCVVCVFVCVCMCVCARMYVSTCMCMHAGMCVLGLNQVSITDMNDPLAQIVIQDVTQLNLSCVLKPTFQVYY